MVSTRVVTASAKKPINDSSGTNFFGLDCARLFGDTTYIPVIREVKLSGAVIGSTPQSNFTLLIFFVYYPN